MMSVTSGETNLHRLLASMQPNLSNQTFVFTSLSTEEFALVDLDHVTVLVREQEGVTLVLESELATHYAFSVSSNFAMITLDVHSSLEAVGLTAAFATALGEAGISANVIAGFYHDHIFVAEADGETALKTLRALSAKHGASDRSDDD